MDKIPDVIVVGLAVGVFVGGTVWTLAWWLSSQFNSIKTFVFEQMSRLENSIVAKLEYHEKHDDSRFDSIVKDLWEVKLRLVAKDARKDLDK